MPEADEPADDDHREGQVGVADVVERGRVEDLADVEHEQEVDRHHAQPVDVGSSGRLHRFHSFAKAFTRTRTTVSFATASSTGCGCGSQWRWTAQNTTVSITSR